MSVRDRAYANAAQARVAGAKIGEGTMIYGTLDLEKAHLITIGGESLYPLRHKFCAMAIGAGNRSLSAIIAI